MDLKDTELTLGLPGGSRSPPKPSSSQIILNLTLHAGNSSISTVESPPKSEIESSSVSTKPNDFQPSDQYIEEVVGWPPVRSWRKKIGGMKSSYVKVGVDGIPYLRKVDLQTYDSYHHLLIGLRDMFTCFNVYEGLWKLVDPTSKREYVASYEDRDGDRMLLGDVPWKMFVESCKRLRLTRLLHTRL